MQIMRRIGASLLILASSVFFWGDIRLFADSPSVSFSIALPGITQKKAETVDTSSRDNKKRTYWDHVEALYMESFGYKKADNPPCPTCVNQGQPIERKPIDEREALEHLFAQFKPQAPIDEIVSKQSFDVLKDLRILYGTEKNKHIHLMSKIDRTHTLLGRTQLVYYLAQPKTESEVLHARQNLIRELIDNPQLLSALEDQLLHIKNIQYDLLTLLFKGQRYGSEGLYMPIDAIPQVKPTDSRIWRVIGTTLAKATSIKNYIANKVNTADIPYVGTAGLEVFSWWQKWQIARILGMSLLWNVGQKMLMDRSTLSTQQQILEDTFKKVDDLERAQLAQNLITSAQVGGPQSAVLAHEYANDLMNGDLSQYESIQQYIQAGQVLGALPMAQGLLNNYQAALINGTASDEVAQDVHRLSTTVAQNLMQLNIHPGSGDLGTMRNLLLDKALDIQAALANKKVGLFNALKNMLSFALNPADPRHMVDPISGIPLDPALHNTWRGTITKGRNAVSTVAIGLMMLGATWSIADSYATGIEALREHLATVSVVERSRKDLASLVQTHAVLANALSLESNNALLATTGSPKFQQLLELLRSSVFEKKAGLFTLGSGKILATYKIVQDVKPELIQVLQAIGELDALVSIARLYMEHAKHNVHYSFAEYVSHDHATLVLKNVWNPFIALDEVVANDISLGLPGQAQHVLLTGSNTGGKSTLIRAMGIAAHMGQTLGIVPADQAIMTPFDQIIVLLNVSDDPSAKESTFAAEGSRAQDLLNRLKVLPQNGRALIFIDELFKGTDHYKGLKWALAITQYIARSPKHILCFFATHFHELTRLEEITNGLYRNFSMDAIKNTDGSYRCSYKLAQGPCTVNIADDIMRDKLDGFDLGDVDKDLDDLLLPTTS